MKYEAFIVVSEEFFKTYNMNQIYYMLFSEKLEDKIEPYFDGSIHIESGDRVLYLSPPEKQIVWVCYSFFSVRDNIDEYISKVMEVIKDSERVIYIPNLADASSENDFDIAFPRAYARAIKKPIEIIHEWEFDNYFKHRR